MKIQKIGTLIGVACLGSFAAFFSLHTSAAQAPVPTARLVGEWEGGNQINLCSTGGGRCIPAEFPAEIGTPKKLIDGDFVKGSPLSWIVLSKKSASLCSVSSASPSIDCVALSKNFELSNLHVSRDIAGGYRWDFHSKKSNAYIESKVNKFLAAFNVARDALEARQKTLANGTSDGGGMMTIQECDCVDPGGGDSGGGGGDIGGGGGDSGGGVTPVSGDGGEGQVVVITGPRPAPPPLTDPTEPPLTMPDPGFWCGVFGINCPDVPKVPDPLPYDCKAHKNYCIDKCSKEKLPTPPADYGAAFYRCVNQCMDEAGCLGKA